MPSAARSNARACTTFAVRQRRGHLHCVQWIRCFWVTGNAGAFITSMNEKIRIRGDKVDACRAEGMHDRFMRQPLPVAGCVFRNEPRSLQLSRASRCVSGCWWCSSGHRRGRDSAVFGCRVRASVWRSARRTAIRRRVRPSDRLQSAARARWEVGVTVTVRLAARKMFSWGRAQQCPGLSASSLCPFSLVEIRNNWWGRSWPSFSQGPSSPRFCWSILAT